MARIRRRLFTASEDAVLVAKYADTATKPLAVEMGRTAGSVYQRARQIGLRKSASYLQSPSACRLRRGDQVGKACRFLPGHVPANKGLRRPGWGPGRMKQTQFQRGVRQGVALTLWKPIGTERISKDGYLERKVNNDLPLQARWRAVHLVVWEAAHGPSPAGHAVVFRDGNKRDIRLENLECISRHELMARNTIHRLPKPLAQAVRVLATLNRQIRKRAQHEPHN